jgi:hypothetical protein
VLPAISTAFKLASRSRPESFADKRRHVTRQVTRYFRVRATFPPEDPLAVEVARLAILLQDLDVVATAIHPASELRVPNSRFRRPDPDHVRTFAFRSLLVILITARDGLSAIAKLLHEQRLDTSGAIESRIAETVVEFARVLRKADTTRLARNKIGGHLDLDAVKAVLEGYDESVVSQYSFSRAVVANDHRFAHELGGLLLEDPVSRAPHDALMTEAWDCGFTLSRVGVQVIALYLRQRAVRAI